MQIRCSHGSVCCWLFSVSLPYSKVRAGQSRQSFVPAASPTGLQVCCCHGAGSVGSDAQEPHEVLYYIWSDRPLTLCLTVRRWRGTLHPTSCGFHRGRHTGDFILVIMRVLLCHVWCQRRLFSLFYIILHEFMYCGRFWKDGPQYVISVLYWYMKILVFFSFHFVLFFGELQMSFYCVCVAEMTCKTHKQWRSLFPAYSTAPLTTAWMPAPCASIDATTPGSSSGEQLWVELKLEPSSGCWCCCAPAEEARRADLLQKAKAELNTCVTSGFCSF